MNKPGSKPSGRMGSSKLALELYKTAFARLTFQDEYLFKFSTVFLTAHGALVLLARSAYAESAAPHYGVLTFASFFGLFLALVWVFWTRHNDYWHSVWKGTLIEIEQKHFKGATPVFSANHEEIAKKGKRSVPVMRGHWIALLIPLGLATAWGFALYFAVCNYTHVSQPSAPAVSLPPAN